MKKLSLFMAAVLITGNIAFAKGNTSIATYGLHLYFDETEFVDVLTLRYQPDGTISGHMSVPDDFEGEIENVSAHRDVLEFDLLVPKNSARPKDLMFHYNVRLFDKSKRQLIGFVTLKGESDFIASFVAFKRDERQGQMRARR